MKLNIRVLRDLDESRAIRDDWARLVMQEGGGINGFDVTATFEWTEALWQGLLYSAPQVVLVAEDESGIRGLLPCLITSETISNVPHRKLTSISSLYELRTGFLVGGNAEVLSELISYAFNEVPGWDTFVFRVVDSSPSDIAIREVLRRSRRLFDEQACWTSPYISLPLDKTQAINHLSPKMRFNLRRGQKQLQRHGELVMRLYDTVTSVPDFIDLMRIVESRSWKVAAGTSMTSDDRQQTLYNIVTPAMAERGWFLGAALMLDAQPVAFIYGYVFSGVFVDEKESYDEKYKDFGPGNVLKAMFLEELVKRGVNTYDYAGRSDLHKSRWTNQLYSRHIYIVYNKTIRGQLVKLSLRLRKSLSKLIKIIQKIKR